MRYIICLIFPNIEICDRKITQGKHFDKQQQIVLCGQIYQILTERQIRHIYEIYSISTHPVKGHAAHLL